MSRTSGFPSFSLLLIAAAAASWQCGGAAPCPTSANTATEQPISEKAAGDACIATANIKRGQRPTEPAKIAARHLLVQYQGAKTARGHIVRFRDEACLRAMKARDELRAGKNFADVVKKYTDESGGEERGGALGTIERKDVVPAFGNAAFELMPHEISDVVETEFGFHVIERTE